MRDSDIDDVACGVEEIVLDGLILGSEFQEIDIWSCKLNQVTW
jgi:hypothetical protein